MTVCPHHYLEKMPPFCPRARCLCHCCTPPSAHRLCEFRGPPRSFQQISAPRTIAVARRRCRSPLPLSSPSPLVAAVPMPVCCRRRRRHRSRSRRCRAAAVDGPPPSHCAHKKAKSEPVCEHMRCNVCVSRCTCHASVYRAHSCNLTSGQTSVSRSGLKLFCSPLVLTSDNLFPRNQCVQ